MYGATVETDVQGEPPAIPAYSQCYVDGLGKFVWFLEHESYPLALEQISPSHIRAFFVYLQQRHERWDSASPNASKALSQSTANAYGRVLRAFSV